MLWCRDFTQASWVSSGDATEMVTNGGFDADTDFVKSAGASIAAGKATLTITGGGMEYVYQSGLNLAANKKYLVTIDATRTAGTGELTFSSNNGTSNLPTGTLFNPITASGVTTIAIYTAGEAISNLGIKRLTTSGDYTWEINSFSVQLSAVQPSMTKTGIDKATNSSSLLTARASNATILQTITAAAAAGSSSFYVKRSVGTGTISFTRDGGATWLDITNQINSNTFSRVMIENDTRANPSIGFKISTSGDAIIVDYGQNEAGTNCTNPILTTSTTNNRTADSLSYPSTGNIFNASGSIIATLYREKWSVMAGSVVGDDTGLHLTVSPAVSGKDGTNTITNAITQTSGSRKVGISWEASTMKVFDKTDFGTFGAYDGSMDLTSIKIYSGASGSIKDLGIWNAALSEEDFKKAILSLPTENELLKNTNNECAILLNQEGVYYIDASTILSKSSKKVNTVSGSNIITLSTGYDNVAIVVGGRVTNADLSLNAEVTAISGRTITLDTNVSFTRNNETVDFESQVAISPYINISNIIFSVASGSSIRILRGAELIYSLYGTDEFDLNELGGLDTSGVGLTIDLPANSVLELKMKKTGNWGNNNNSYGGI